MRPSVEAKLTVSAMLLALPEPTFVGLADLNLVPESFWRIKGIGLRGYGMQAA